MDIKDNIRYKIARVGLHHFEEPCLSGDRGSGTIFFSGCNLRCIYCQNAVISHGGVGLEVSEDELIDCMLYLQDKGAHNINLVTPSIWTNMLIHTLDKAKSRVKVPFVWNSSGYEKVENLQKLEGLIDVYLPDYKYGDDELAWEYSHVRAYNNTARNAIAEMKKQQPEDIFDEDGIMQSGVIVRHLVLPNAIENSRAVLKEVAKIDKNCIVSLMGQYFPTAAVAAHPELSRRLRSEEYEEATDAFFEVGLSRGFSQDLDSAKEEYVPDFNVEEIKNILKIKR